jgi:quercetin dioxygenase-like cupin family protein
MHDNHAEGCYVLQGTLAMTENDQMWTLSQGAFARIPSGTRHALWNPSAAPTTILLIYQPATTEAEALALALGHSPARTA